jgi:hypothetical protein
MQSGKEEVRPSATMLPGSFSISESAEYSSVSINGSGK